MSNLNKWADDGDDYDDGLEGDMNLSNTTPKAGSMEKKPVSNEKTLIPQDMRKDMEGMQIKEEGQSCFKMCVVS
eukprot:CAMPEP_0194587894 /NCGR_PEP_ID=MMETSP0292-20121207/19440_1 /TAXON_ID=39354 /ORGANISM="Heterosigma akashiwo, Strain CCMP2393" /LENGTH=73 /DNA_ID=CAMNT_0039444261 /DNA_START=27 /DNA_END=248 /DNA_ORIENTATION=+